MPNRIRKPGSKSRGVAALMESVAEMENFAKKGMTIDDVKRHYQRHRPDLVCTMHIPGPGKYSPAAVRKMRSSLGMSQIVFAELVGVSGILVQSWERGVRTPSPLARRLFDTISQDPVLWLAGLGKSAGPKPRRVG